MSGKYWDKAWSLVDGCTPCSPGCDNCWSSAMELRFGDNQLGSAERRNLLSVKNKNQWGYNGNITLHPARLDIPIKRKKPTVWAIWNDLFHEDVPTRFIDDVLEVISACPQHTFLVLTKRAHLIEDKLYGVTSEHGFRVLGGGDYLPNLWLGVTVCNQHEADEKIPSLLQAPAAHRWISIEPMLGEIDIIGDFVPLLEGINAVVLGGETGPHARPMNPNWVRSVRDQCNAAGVPFFFKQWGEWKQSTFYTERHKQVAFTDDGRILSKDEYSEGYIRFGHHVQMSRLGTAASGRLLDGREHNDLPWRQS